MFQLTRLPNRRGQWSAHVSVPLGRSTVPEVVRNSGVKFVRRKLTFAQKPVVSVEVIPNASVIAVASPATIFPTSGSAVHLALGLGMRTSYPSCLGRVSGGPSAPGGPTITPALKIDSRSGTDPLVE